jgi:putative transposase
LLKPSGYKDLIQGQLKALCAEFQLELTAWVILDNHYHILLKSKVGTAIPRFIGRLHGGTSFELNHKDNARGRQVWHNYWDTCIRTERDYWMRFNYVHHNPIKHGYVNRMEDWGFSSYRFYLENKGAEWLGDTWAQYPVVDFTDPRDVF